MIPVEHSFILPGYCKTDKQWYLLL